MSRSIRGYRSLALAGALCLLTTPALAQDKPSEANNAAPKTARPAKIKPLRVGVYDVTDKPRDSKNITPRVKKWLEELEHINVAADNDLSTAVSVTKIEKSSLRSKDLSKSSSALSNILESASVDALVLVHVKRKGAMLQLTLIGPDGAIAGQKQLKLKSKRKVRDRELKKLVGGHLLELRDTTFARRSVDAAHMTIRAAIADGIIRSEETSRDREALGATSASEDAEVDVSSTLELGEARAVSTLPRALRVELGPLFASRAVTFDNVAQTVEFNNPFIGAIGGVDVGWTTGNLRVGALINGAWGTGQARGFDERGEEAILETQLIRAAGELRGHYRFNSSFALGLGLGAEHLAMTIDENPNYTGHRYTSGLAVLSARIAPTRKLLIELGGGARSILSAPTHDSSFGDADFTAIAGWTARARLELELTRSLYAILGYRAERLVPDYAEQNTSSRELFQLGELAVGWSL